MINKSPLVALAYTTYLRSFFTIFRGRFGRKPASAQQNKTKSKICWHHYDALPTLIDPDKFSFLSNADVVICSCIFVNRDVMIRDSSRVTVKNRDLLFCPTWSNQLKLLYYINTVKQRFRLDKTRTMILLLKRLKNLFPKSILSTILLFWITFYENISPTMSEVFYQTKNIHFVFIWRIFQIYFFLQGIFFSRVLPFQCFSNVACRLRVKNKRSYNRQLTNH